MSDNLTLTAPERIYLCVSDDPYDRGRDESFPDNHKDVSWSTDQPVNQTVEYVRADLVPFHALIEVMRQPMWMDAPNAPGLWFFDAPNTACMRIHPWTVDEDAIKGYEYMLPQGGKWFGPIPEDK